MRDAKSPSWPALRLGTATKRRRRSRPCWVAGRQDRGKTASPAINLDRSRFSAGETKTCVRGASTISYLAGEPFLFIRPFLKKRSDFTTHSLHEMKTNPGGARASRGRP